MRRVIEQAGPDGRKGESPVQLMLVVWEGQEIFRGSINRRYVGSTIVPPWRGAATARNRQLPPHAMRE